MNNSITIGIPVYNEEKFLERTINSVLSNNPETIIISDNASTDRSSEIAEGFARRHACIIYKRFDTQIPVIDNFNYSLNLCQSDFFMWCGGHDLIPQNYLSELKKIQRPRDVMSFSPATMIDPDGHILSEYDYFFADLLAHEDPFVRTLSLITYLTNCSLFHGLFRTSFLRNFVKDLPCCIGNDNVLLCRAATAGTFSYTRETNFGRRIIYKESYAQASTRRAKTMNSRNTDAKESALHQFKSICSIKTTDYRKKLLFCEKARATLTARYGQFI